MDVPRPRRTPMDLRLTGAVLDANGLNDWWRESLPDTADEPQIPDTEVTDGIDTDDFTDGR